MIEIRNRYTGEVLLRVDADTLRGAVGNSREIRSLRCDTWPVVVAGGVMAIGCQQHSLSDWWAFTDEQIAVMDRRALDWWRRWKPILRQMFGEADDDR